VLRMAWNPGVVSDYELDIPALKSGQIKMYHTKVAGVVIPYIWAEDKGTLQFNEDKEVL